MAWQKNKSLDNLLQSFHVFFAHEDRYLQAVYPLFALFLIFIPKCQIKACESYAVSQDTHCKLKHNPNVCN